MNKNGSITEHILVKGTSINDVTALGGGGNKDFVTTVLKPCY